MCARLQTAHKYRSNECKPEKLTVNRAMHPFESMKTAQLIPV